MADHNLPTEIMISILQRLPPKTLVKFLCVSKSWYSLITSPTFNSSHFHYHYNSNFNHHLFFLEFDYHYSICRYGQSLNDRSRLASPTGGSAFNSVIGSCNGVICLHNNNYNGNDNNPSLCLWNPSIHKHLMLDPIPLLDNNLVLGFVFHSSTNDYKVVAIAHAHAPTIYNNLPQAMFYSLRSKTWNGVEFPAMSSGLPVYSWETTSSINGVAYWLMYHRIRRGVDDDDFHATLVKFDANEEAFRELQLPPPGLIITTSNSFTISVINNWLALFQFVVADRSYVVWQNKEDHGLDSPWTPLYKIELFPGYRCLDKIFVNWEDRGYIIIGSGSLFTIDIKKLSCERVIISRQAFCYIESLALLDNV